MDQALAGQSLADVRVFDDIAVVVEQNERIRVDRPVDCRHGRDQQETDEQFAPHGILELVRNDVAFAPGTMSVQSHVGHQVTMVVVVGTRGMTGLLSLAETWGKVTLG